MRTLIFSAVVATSLLAAPSFAAADKAKANKAKAPVVMTDAQMDNVVAGAAPANPGGFGQARAAYLAGDGITGWGKIASERAQAGTHQDNNDASKLSTGALPAPGAP